MTRLRQVPQAPTIFTPFVTMENFEELPMPPPVCTPYSFGHSSSYIFSRQQGWRRDCPQPHHRDPINAVGGVLRKIVTCTADNQRKAASLASTNRRCWLPGHHLTCLGLLQPGTRPFGGFSSCYQWP